MEGSARVESYYKTDVTTHADLRHNLFVRIAEEARDSGGLTAEQAGELLDEHLPEIDNDPKLQTTCTTEERLEAAAIICRRTVEVTN